MWKSWINLWKWGVRWLLGRFLIYWSPQSKSIPHKTHLHHQLWTFFSLYLYFYLYLSYKMCWVCLFSAIFYNDKILCFGCIRTHTHIHVYTILHTHIIYIRHVSFLLLLPDPKVKIVKVVCYKVSMQPLFSIHSHHFFLLYSIVVSYSKTFFLYVDIDENDDDDDTNLYFYT